MMLLKAHMELSKVRLNAMVVFTTAVGFVAGTRWIADPLAGSASALYWPRLFWTCLGTFIAAAGASAFNQALEAPRDARMNRTRNRPLVTGVFSRTYAATFGLVVSIVGVAILCPTSNGTTAILASATVLIYIAIYTPMKPKTAANTLVGAIVGAIPPVLGWTAATGSVAPAALLLGAILFLWQIPHFLALSWIYREDYARGGFKMLSVVEPTGRLTTRLALLYSLLLIPICILLTFFQSTGILFATFAVILTAGLAAVALRFVLTRANDDARMLFFASIIYLPLLCSVLMADARAPDRRDTPSDAGFFLAPDASSVPPAGDSSAIDPESDQGQSVQSDLNAAPGFLPSAAPLGPPVPQKAPPR